jgi:periplasmic protein TonB
MNHDEMHSEIKGQIPAEMEARILAWVLGAAPEQESAELARLTRGNAALAAVKARFESAQRLIAEAVQPDREPLKLSGARRAALLEALPMRRQDLLVGALFSIALVTAVAWYGERTHWVRPISTRHDTTIVAFPLPPLDPDPQEIADAGNAKSSKEEVTIPAQPDLPRINPPDNSFTQPIEPARPNTDFQDTDKIPNLGPSGPISTRPFDPSQLDQQAVPRFQAKPEYPYGMKQEGLSGEVMVAFIVDANGNVRNAVAVHSSRSEFEAPACKAVSRWKFKPGRKGGRAVAVHMEVPIVFAIGNAD